jgi:hypothetical protein
MMNLRWLASDSDRFEGLLDYPCTESILNNVTNVKKPFIQSNRQFENKMKIPDMGGIIGCG